MILLTLVERHFKRSKAIDGGFAVSKEFIVAVSFVLLLIGAFVPYVWGYAILNNKVSVLEEDWKNAGPVHTSIIKDIQARLTADEKELALLESKLDTIQASIAEIKSDIKEIKTELKSIN